VKVKSTQPTTWAAVGMGNLTDSYFRVFILITGFVGLGNSAGRLLCLEGLI
jgi:hypothetical protein